MSNIVRALDLRKFSVALSRTFSSSHPKLINCHRASIARLGRQTYMLMYPTVVVNSDGSTFIIRYHEPRKIIQLPLDITKLTEEEQKKRLSHRKPKTKVVIEEEVDDTFSLENYEHLWKKKN